MIISRKEFLAASILVVGLGANLPFLTVPAASAAEANADAEAMAALKTWWGALVAGTPAAVGAVLAPEFQMQRADGSGYNKTGYLKSALPKIAALPEFSKVTVTGAGDLLIVRYSVTVNETRDGKTVQKHAPRLTIFRKKGEAWLVAAHANFATLEK